MHSNEVGYRDDTCCQEGGAIYNDDGTITINNSNINYNEARGDGGAIHNSGTLIIKSNSIIRYNDAAVDGGAIFNYGTLSITNSTINSNYAEDDGGAIFDQGTLLTITNSNINSNFADDDGAQFATMVPHSTSRTASSIVMMPRAMVVQFSIRGATVNITDSSFYNNDAIYDGWCNL